jgi:YesN/AraC family two-component response regulator
MYKVIIAEDELLVRIGIKASILQSNMPLTVVGDTSNGLSAYEIFHSKHPDIVITDIKMPGLDGIELIRKIRKEDRDCAIIVISCLEEFSILKQAIESNVSAYLLKATMTMEEITSSLKKAIDDLKGKNRFPDDSDHDRKSTISAEGLLTDFMNGSLSEGALIDQLSDTGFIPDKVAVFFFKGRKLDSITKRSLEEVLILRLASKYEILSFPIEEGLIVPLHGTGEGTMPLMEQLQLYIKETFSLHPVILVKSLNGKFEHFPAEMKRCFAEEREISYFGINHPVTDNWMKTLPGHVNTLLSEIEAENDIIKIMPDVDYKRYDMQMEKIKRKASDGRAAFVDGLLNGMDELFPSIDRLSDSRVKIRDAKTCKDALKIYLRCIHEGYDKQGYKTMNYEITNAVQYINEHFMEPLTLKGMASIAGLTPNYFSNLFTKEMRQNFISYLNRIRVEKAKRLLAETDLLVYEVAQQVGFEDEAYFCRMFKKITGQRPKSWRAGENRYRGR